MTAHLEVLRLDCARDETEYVQALKEIDNSSPFHTLAFVTYFSEGLQNLICFKWQCNNKIILLIGYLKTIENQPLLKDFRSPYGYSGPIYNSGVTKDMLTQFWNDVNKWLISQKSVTSFIRFSLNNNWGGYQGKLVQTLLNVNGVIQPKEQQWKNFEPKVRKNVNRAKREGLTSQIVSGSKINIKELKSFYKIYTSTLLRNSAIKSHYSSLKDFKQYCSQKGNSCIFAFVYYADKMVATEMVLLSGDTIYSFLGGTVQSLFDKRPNDFLKYNLINWARDNGFSYFVLGGGLGKEDGIFRYKKSFFPDDIVPFYTGRQIFNQEKYRQLSNQKKLELTNEEKEALSLQEFFPVYRYPRKAI